ncbi:MAG: HAD family hydrolase [Candidatus Njordarchaeia archaeon]|nr:HAD family hydrolase [Candidatus Korarchaeota archaeon]
MSIRGVIFDIDGTLVDSLELMALAADNIAKSMNIEINIKKIPNLVGKKPEAIIEEIFDVHKKSLILKIKELWAEEASRLVIEEKRAKLFPNVLKVLSWLKNHGYKVGLGSSLTRDLIEGIADAYGFRKYIDAYVGSDEIKEGKPAPDTFLEVAKRLEIKPKEAIVVGDTEYDVLAGHEGGFLTVLFDPNTQKKPNQWNTKPDFIIRDLIEIIDIIQKLSTK